MQQSRTEQTKNQVDRESILFVATERARRWKTPSVSPEQGSRRRLAGFYRSHSPALRGVCLLLASVMAGLCVSLPMARAEQTRQVAQRNALAHKAQRNAELKPGQTQAPDDALLQKILAHKQPAARPDVRALTPAEMRHTTARGTNRTVYRAGTLPWHRALRDMNLCNGNLFKSFTDIQVAPAKGAGLALQRTYNAHDDKIGPFGIGWQHAYDIRMEEENPTTNQQDTSLNYADRVDFFGGRHKYHRDADGLYTPPPYLFDELDSGYDKFLVNGPIKPLEDTQKSMDGTVKHFLAIGNERVCDSITDRYGNVTSLTYTTVQIGGVNKGLLATVTDPSNRTLTFTWSNLGTVGSPLWRITQVNGPAYNVTYTYNAEANLWKVTLDPTGLNRTTTYGYTTVGGESGLLNSLTDPLGNVLTYGYSLYTGNGYSLIFVNSVSEPVGNGNTLTYSVDQPALPGMTTQVQVQQGGLTRLRLNVDSSLRKWAYVHLGSSSLLQATTYDSANNATTLAYNGFQDSPNMDRQDNYTYGSFGNVLTHTLTGVSGTETTEYYDASQYFMKKSVTDMAGRKSMFGVGTSTDTTVGNRGSILWVKDAKYGDGTYNNTGTRFAYSYNSNGQKVSETNPNGVVTNYTYGDQWGNLTAVVQDAGTGKLNRTTTLVYDSSGRVTSSTDPFGKTATFTYNSLGQPLSAAFAAKSLAENNNTVATPAETLSYAYASNGRMTSVSDNRGTTSLSYVPNCDRVQSVTDPVTGSLSYTYNDYGQRTSLALPGGGTWTYTYDNASQWAIPGDDPNKMMGRLTRITDDQNRIVDYVFSIYGILKQTAFNQTFDAGTGVLMRYVVSDYTYDASGTYRRGLVSQVKQTLWWRNIPNNSAPLFSQTLTQNDYASYDAVGNRLSNTIGLWNASTSQMDTRIETYGYDELYRLTSVNYGDGQTQSYAFDPMGNRTSKTDAGGGINGTENYTVNNANMLLTRGANTYTNDVNGNTLTGGGRTNTWDSQNRLVKCVNGANTSTFTYGSDGLRRQSVVNGTTTDFVLDNGMFLRERRAGANIATYLMGASGPVYRRDDTTGTVRWYLYDGLGSVLAEVDPNGNLTAKRKYDVYGAVRSGDAGTSKHKFVGQLGHPSEDETGLVYMRARYMDPQTGRFISEDPAKNSANWYAYCGGNPTNRVDSTGKYWGLAVIVLAALINGFISAQTGNGFWKGFFIGAICGAISALGGVVCIAFELEAGMAVLVQALFGGLAGGLNSGLSGGNVGLGIVLGLLLGGLGGCLDEEGVEMLWCIATTASTVVGTAIEAGDSGLDPIKI